MTAWKEGAPIPPALAASLEAALRSGTSRSPRIASARSVSGGCINDSRVVATSEGDEFFLKLNSSATSAFFEAEADGLAALAATGTVRVPDVLAHGDSDAGAWLLLEYVPAGQATSSYWRDLGEGVAALHGVLGPGPGYQRDNFIGSLPQTNDPCPDWAGFWIDCRIRPQLELAHDAGLLDAESPLWARLLEAVPDVLDGAPVGGASLLHGDLWSGNVYPDTDGRPVLIDPAVYHGDPEVDLAMAALFGGFDDAFYDAYSANRTIVVDDFRTRRSLYQLYPLLVHVNLFGAGYAASARARAAEVVSG